MQAAIEQESPQVIRVEVTGRLTSQQWHATLKDVAKRFAPGRSTSILLIAEGFEGWEPGNWDDLSFQREHDAQIERIAIVADERWRDRVLMFAGQGLRKVDIRFFTPAEMSQARQWLAPAPPRDAVRSEGR
jgi:hypothetical protein